MCPQLLVESLIYFRYQLPSIPAFSGGTAYISITSFKAHACSGVKENICHLPSRLKTKWNVKRSVCILVYVCLKCFRQNSWWYTVHFTPYALLTAEKKNLYPIKMGYIRHLYILGLAKISGGELECIHDSGLGVLVVADDTEDIASIFWNSNCEWHDICLSHIRYWLHRV